MNAAAHPEALGGRVLEWQRWRVSGSAGDLIGVAGGTRCRCGRRPGRGGRRGSGSGSGRGKSKLVQLACELFTLRIERSHAPAPVVLQQLDRLLRLLTLPGTINASSNYTHFSVVSIYQVKIFLFSQNFIINLISIKYYK